MNPSNFSPPDSGATERNDPASSANAGSTTGGIKDTAREKAQQLKGAAAGAAQQVKERASAMVGERREQVADRIGGYSSAIHQSAQSFEQQDPNIAWFTHQAAERLESVAEYVRSRDFNGLRADAESFGRRHPALLLGGLFLTGFLVGSAIKAGRTVAEESMTEDNTDFDYNYDPETTAGEGMATQVPPVSGAAEI